ncbi:MAG: aldehyde dehydrogenase family protein [Methanomicrobiaceae archaeon]|nr:aldehyde dehydrogenase family protein [Methanomicrobiaceae archaeon]MDD5418657.1 aldehyde dehydrogenase family protein [Methanomicrobiaceae archaeon]
MNEPRPFLVGGEWRMSGECADIRFPYDSTAIGRVCLAADADIEDSVLRATAGFSVTRALPAHRRASILSALAGEIGRRSDELAAAIVLEAGKARPLAEAEVQRAMETIRISAEEAKRTGGEILPLDWTPAGEGYTGYVRRFPLGVVLGITPFNFPFNLACHKLGPAFAAGNAFILRPSTKTPLSSLLLGEMALDAGIPPEAISVVPCTAARAERLAADPRIAYLSFTGSPAVGWHLKAIAGRKRVGLELGGNAAVIVHADADPAFAAARIVNGGFANAGQICISVQRVFLHRSVYDEALGRIVAGAQALRAGDPRDPSAGIGPMISPEAASAAMEMVREAVAGGANVLAGGTCDGTLFAPTVLAETTPDMRVNTAEIFAPVISVTPYDEIEDAIGMANESEYGLQMGIFTRDIEHILSAFDDCEAGALIVNDIPTLRMDHMPYGGVKGSGLGREGPRYAIEEMTEMKMLVINRADAR